MISNSSRYLKVGILTTLFVSAFILSSIAFAQDDAEPQIEAPVVDAQITEAMALAQTELDAPQITPGPSVTLQDALKRASQRNLDLATARLEIEKAKAGLSKSWGLVLPVLQGKLDYTRMDHADEVDLASGFLPLLDAMGVTLPPGTDLGEPLLTNPQDKVTGALQLAVPLVNPQGWMQIHTARKGVEVAEISIEKAQRQILVGVAQSYFMVLTTRDVIDFHYSQMQTIQEQLRVANARFRAGKGMRIDVIRAETDFEQARQSLLSSLLAFDNARDTLGQLIGINELPLPADKPVLKAPAKDVNALEQDALAAHLDVQLGTAKRELYERQKKAVWMQFLPRLDMNWQGSYQFTDLPDMGSDDRSRWALMFSLTVPLYNHFRYAELDEKRASIRQAELSLENTNQKVQLAVRKAGRDYATSLAAVVTAEKQVALAEEGVLLTDAAYRNGRGTSLDVTLARQTHTAAGLNLATLQFRAQLSLLTLLDAIGEDISAQIVR